MATTASIGNSRRHRRGSRWRAVLLLALIAVLAWYTVADRILEAYGVDGLIVKDLRPLLATR